MKITKKTSFLLTASGILLVVITTIYAGLSRFIARDEGYFLYAARMMQDGVLPYRDFFFPQTPLAPIIFSVWFDLTGTGWFQARILTAILTSCSAYLLFIAVREIYSTATAHLSLFIYAVTVGVLVWFPTAQANCVTLTLLLSSLVAIRVCNNSFLAGAMFGFSITSRLTIAPFVIVMLIEAVRNKSSVDAIKSTWRFCLGLCVPFLSVLSIAILDFENFIDHNLRYHLERTAMSQNQLTANRWRVVAALLGVRNGTGLGGIQFQVLLYGVVLLGGWSLLQYFRKFPPPQIFDLLSTILKKADPFFIGACILTLVHLIPEPTYLQYFSLVEILLIPPFAFYFLSLLRRLVKFTHLVPQMKYMVQPISLIFTILFVVFYSILGLSDLQKYLFTGDEVIGVGRINREAWRISTIKAISARIDQNASKDDYILASWPGYCVETKAQIIPGLESNFGPQWARNAMFSKEEQTRRRILSWERAIKRFAKDKVKLAVLFLGIGRTNNLEVELIRVGGIKISSLKGIGMYRKSA